jgi:glycosyltransferase involved in cell wall biosynthesis
LFVSRSCPKHKIEVVMNAPDEKIFIPRPAESPAEGAEPKPFTLMYHGTVVERHGLGTALDAIAQLRDKIPQLQFHVYGEGNYVEGFLRKRDELKLQDCVHYHGQVSMERIAEAIPSTDIGLIPNLRSVFTEINMPTRIFEYLSMNKPVIVPKTAGIADYFNGNSLMYFNSGNPRSLADTIYDAWRSPEKREQSLRESRLIYQRHRWEQEKKKLLQAYNNLLCYQSYPVREELHVSRKLASKDCS